MDCIRLLGIDTGFVATGLALIEWDGSLLRVVKVRTVNTEPTAKKRRLLVVDDHLRRIREIHAGVVAMLEDPRPNLVSMEAFSQSRNAAAAARQAFGYATAIVDCEQSGIPVVQFTPAEIRKRLGVPKPEKPKPDRTPREKAEDAKRRKAAVWLRCADLVSVQWSELTEHESDAVCVALAALIPEPIDLVRAAVGGA